MFVLGRILIIVTLFVLFLNDISFPQQIGKAWEFNETGNFEGIIIGNSFQDSSVENGYLKAITSGTFPSLSSEPFELEAIDYGYIQIRMKLPGATSGKIMWDNDSDNWGFAQFVTNGDSAFQEFDIPVYLSNQWTGKITKIKRLDFNPSNGSTVEIDYIRIVSIGAKPAITNFTPLRTIFKQNVEIPLLAMIQNDGDIEAALSTKLILPEGVTLVNGSIENEHGIIFKEAADTLNWIIKFENLGQHELILKLFNESDTIEKSIVLNVTDQYWVQNKFFLSAWSPPALTTDAYNYYDTANFQLVLSVPPDEVSVTLAEQYGMEYQLRAGSLIGEHNYLRAPDNIAPEDLTADDLAKLDGMISTFKDREGVLGYYLTDEPNANAFPNLGKTVSYLRERDPTRLSFINLFPTYASDEQLGTPTYDEHVRQFLDVVKPEILSYDHYHFFNGYDGGGYFTNLGIIRKWALTYDVPFCNIIQAIGTNGTSETQLNWRSPSAAEHRWLVYSSLAYGAKAIVWFHWDHSWGLTGSPDRVALYASIQNLNQEINKIGNILFNINSVGVHHSKTIDSKLQLPPDGIVKAVSDNADILIGYFKDAEQNDYFMLMNKNYNDSVIAKITLNGTAEDLQYFDVDKNQWQVVSKENVLGESIFDVPLRPGDGRLFLVGRLTEVSNSYGDLPLQFELKQNYPNPFNPVTTITYSIPQKSNVKLEIYNVLGQMVDQIINKEVDAGNYNITWDASSLTSGLYFFNLKANDYSQTKKMLLLK